MNEFYAMSNWATLFPGFMEGWGGGVRGLGGVCREGNVEV